MYYVTAILPYALSFAAAAMLFVIVRDMIPDVFGGRSESDRMKPALLILAGFVVMNTFETIIDHVTFDE